LKTAIAIPIIANIIAGIRAISFQSVGARDWKIE
jgi:hypothetical protein